MDFEHSPEQVQLRKAVREFAEAELAPHTLEWDEAQTFPREAMGKIAALGYMGSIFPESLAARGSATSTTRSSSKNWRASIRRWR